MTSHNNSQQLSSNLPHICIPIKTGCTPTVTNSNLITQDLDSQIQFNELLSAQPYEVLGHAAEFWFQFSIPEDIQSQGMG